MTPSPRLVQRNAIRAILAFHFQNPSGGVAEIDHFAVVQDGFFSLGPHPPPASVSPSSASSASIFPQTAATEVFGRGLMPIPAASSSGAPVRPASFSATFKT